MNSLSINEIEEARIKILGNARELLEDAELLLSHERFTRAYSLAHLASEEMTKLPMVCWAAISILRGKEVNWSKFDKTLRNHTKKIKKINFIDFLNDPNVDDDEDIKRLEKDIEMVSDYNKLKNISLYTSYEDNKFYKPSELITADLSKEMVKLARNRLTFFEDVEHSTQGKLEEIVKSPHYEPMLKKIINIDESHNK